MSLRNQIRKQRLQEELSRCRNDAILMHSLTESCERAVYGSNAALRDIIDLLESHSDLTNLQIKQIQPITHIFIYQTLKDNLPMSSPTHQVKRHMNLVDNFVVCQQREMDESNDNIRNRPLSKWQRLHGLSLMSACMIICRNIIAVNQQLLQQLSKYLMYSSVLHDLDPVQCFFFEALTLFGNVLLVKSINTRVVQIIQNTNIENSLHLLLSTFTQVELALQQGMNIISNQQVQAIFWFVSTYLQANGMIGKTLSIDLVDALVRGDKQVDYLPKFTKQTTVDYSTGLIKDKLIRQNCYYESIVNESDYLELCGFTKYLELPPSYHSTLIDWMINYPRLHQSMLIFMASNRVGWLSLSSKSQQTLLNSHSLFTPSSIYQVLTNDYFNRNLALRDFKRKAQQMGIWSVIEQSINGHKVADLFELQCSQDSDN